MYVGRNRGTFVIIYGENVITVQYTFYNHCAVITTVVIH